MECNNRNNSLHNPSVEGSIIKKENKVYKISRNNSYGIFLKAGMQPPKVEIVDEGKNLFKISHPYYEHSYTFVIVEVPIDTAIKMWNNLNEDKYQSLNEIFASNKYPAIDNYYGEYSYKGFLQELTVINKAQVNYVHDELTKGLARANPNWEVQGVVTIKGKSMSAKATDMSKMEAENIVAFNLLKDFIKFVLKDGSKNLFFYMSKNGNDPEVTNLCVKYLHNVLNEEPDNLEINKLRQRIDDKDKKMVTFEQYAILLNELEKLHKIYESVLRFEFFHIANGIQSVISSMRKLDEFSAPGTAVAIRQFVEVLSNIQEGGKIAKKQNKFLNGMVFNSNTKTLSKKLKKKTNEIIHGKKVNYNTLVLLAIKFKDLIVSVLNENNFVLFHTFKSY